MPLFGAGFGAPPGVLPLPPPPPLAFLGPPEAQLAADIAAATGQDEDGDTALHIAVAQGSVGLVRRLVALFLRGGRDLDVQNRLRQTPLHVAILASQPALVRLLVAHGACAMARDRRGRTGAHLACAGAGAGVLRELLRGGPDLRATDYEGLTPLHVAVHSGCRESVELLLEHGADVDAVDIKSGRSPLQHAVESNSLDMVELLIQRGADVNAQSYAGCTALHAAAARGHQGALRLLLRSGADCGVRNHHNERPLAVASNRQVIDILRGKSSRPAPPPARPANGRSSRSPAHPPPAANQSAASSEPANEAPANPLPPQGARTDQSAPEPQRDHAPLEGRGQAGGGR